jgi:hypothetical protein
LLAHRLFILSLPATSDFGAATRAYAQPSAFGEPVVPHPGPKGQGETWLLLEFKAAALFASSSKVLVLEGKTGSVINSGRLSGWAIF